MRQTVGRATQSTRATRGSASARLLPAVATALLVRVSVATSGGRYDLRALAAALGLFMILAFALLAVTLEALAMHAVGVARQAVAEARRTRIRFGPTRAPLVVLPPPISAEQLLDKRGRPLRGAARAARMRTLERERSALIAAAQAKRITSTGRVIVLPAPPRIDVALPRVPVPAVSIGSLRAVAITTTMTFVLATIIGTTGLVSRQGTVALGASTTLTVISGAAEVRASPTDEFRPAEDGALLRAGMTIRTGSDTYAVLTYFEGSTVSIDPGTTLVIESLGSDPDGSTIIEMRQDLGRTWHQVTKLVRSGSKYEVRTPSATAQVRGTMFAVGVETDAAGEAVTTVETTEGAVATAKAPTAAEPRPAEEVLVQPGTQVSVKPSAALEQPQPVPEPARKVTVDIGASSGVVVDPVGRTNGIKDGKIVVQTPGATVRIVNGRLEITLPKIPDGRIATLLDPKAAPREPVEVTTTVRERGGAETRSQGRLETATPGAPAVVLMDVKKGVAVEVARVSDEQKRDVAATVKVAEAPKVVAEAKKKDDRGSADKKDQTSGDGPGGAGGPGSGAADAVIGGFVPTISLPSLPGGPDVTVVSPNAKREEARSGAKNDDAKTSGSGERQRSEDGAPAPRVDAPRVEAPRGQPPADTSKRVPAGGSTDQRQASGDRSSGSEPRRGTSESGASGGARNDAPRFVPTFDLPAIPVAETAKRDEPKKDEPRKDEAKNDQQRAAPAPAVQEAPKPEVRRDEPKKDEPKKDQHGAARNDSSRGFVPTLELPRLPVPDAAKREEPKKEEPKVEEQKAPELPRIELPKIELPKIDLPIFRNTDQKDDVKDKIGANSKGKDKSKGDGGRNNDRGDRGNDGSGDRD